MAHVSLDFDIEAVQCITDTYLFYMDDVIIIITLS